MTQQLALFDAKRLARRRDPATSHDAAGNAVNFTAKHEAKIFGAIHDAGDRGATFREIAVATGMEPVAVARRLSAMGERGVIERRTVDGTDRLETRGGCTVWWRA